MQICPRRQPGSGLPWGGLLPPFKFPLNTELLAEDRNFLLLRPSVLGKETLPLNTPPIAVPNQSGDWLKSTAIKSLKVAMKESRNSLTRFSASNCSLTEDDCDKCERDGYFNA